MELLTAEASVSVISHHLSVANSHAPLSVLLLLRWRDRSEHTPDLRWRDQPNASLPGLDRSVSSVQLPATAHTHPPPRLRRPGGDTRRGGGRYVAAESGVGGLC